MSISSPIFFSMYKQILKQYWGYDDFRGIQSEIIESIGAGRDTLGLMPTGGGKSITFQVPAICQEGVCIVITPLIALMKDQVQHLREKGILASAIYSGLTRNEIISTLENCILGNTKLLYVSPERLGSQIFQTKLAHMKVSFICVDEAHCISQWGYDFRPSYLHIADIRKIKPEAPVLALTATATPKVIEDIQARLGFREPNCFRMSFARKNISYIVRKATDKLAEMVHILNSVPGCAIVYARSRQGTKELADLLNENGIPSTFYHAGLEHAIKDLRQQQWQRDEVRVMVATNAFGMGIDKPDVRLVIHIDCPDSIEAYFQEAGRAGRDGKEAYAVLLTNGHDEVKLRRRIADTYPDKEYIRNIYEYLAYFYQTAMGFGRGQTHVFDIAKFCQAYRLFPTLVDSSLKILHNAGYIEYETDPETKARLMITLSRSELSRLETLTPNEEKVMTTLMRMYGGLYSDYVYIDESAVALNSGMEQNEVYIILKGLSHRHIVHFIPEQKIPFITYLQDRDEKDRIVISREVYEDRKAQLEKNINAIIAYTKNDEDCRSVQLLGYFGEEHSKECCKCDVCRDKRRTSQSDAVLKAKELILEILSDGEKHFITELNSIQVSTPDLDKALKNILRDEMAVIDGSYISISK